MASLSKVDHFYCLSSKIRIVVTVVIFRNFELILSTLDFVENCKNICILIALLIFLPACVVC